jgi:protein phosphatase
MHVISSALTDVGVLRRENQDSYARSDNLGLYLVADGMGGHAAGEVASGAAVSAIQSRIQEELDGREPDASSAEEMERWRRVFEEGVHLANESVGRLSRENSLYAGMGTTVSGVLIRGDKACIAHVGDSRVYLLRDGEMKALTSDHSWVNEQLKRNIITPEEAKTHRLRNVITRAVGTGARVEVDTLDVNLRGNDCLLLCSDGLTSMVDESKIEETLTSAGENLDEVCRRLVDMANAAGGKDNITVVILRVLG